MESPQEAYIERTQMLCSRSPWPLPMTYWPPIQKGSSMGLANYDTNYGVPMRNRFKLLNIHSIYSHGQSNLEL